MTTKFVLPNPGALMTAHGVVYVAEVWYIKNMVQVIRWNGGPVGGNFIEQIPMQGWQARFAYRNAEYTSFDATAFLAQRDCRKQYEAAKTLVAAYDKALSQKDEAS